MPTIAVPVSLSTVASVRWMVLPAVMVTLPPRLPTVVPVGEVCVSVAS
ncbi:hypothetical protein P5Y53_08780 [Dyella jiangningensis]|nr:hypothetical protein [Dyella jiangningensis]MDG2537752.1 hypothetical protein [Dyella jiangningensis]